MAGGERRRTLPYDTATVDRGGVLVAVRECCDAVVVTLTGWVRTAPAWALAGAALAIGGLANLLLGGWLAALLDLIALLLLGQALTPRPAASSVAIRATRSPLLAGLAVAAVVLVSVFVKREEPANSRLWGPLLATWLLALLTYALAWDWPSVCPGHVRSLVRAHRVEILVAGSLIGLAFLARSWDLGNYPRTIGGDDGQAALDARRVLRGPPIAPFGVLTIALGQFPALYFYAQSIPMRLFGDDVAGARTLAALLGTGCVAAVWLFGRRWFGAAAALAAAGLLAGLPYHLFWSRSALNNVADALTFIVVPLLTVRALRTGRDLDFALTGLALGLGQYAYQSARLLLVVVPVLLLREAVVKRCWLRRNWRHGLILIGGVVVAVLPLATYFSNHPADYVGRFDQVSIFRSGWLVREVERTGRSSVEILSEQVAHTLQGFYAIGMRGFFEPDRPVLEPFAALMAAAGVAVALAEWRSRACFALLLTAAALVAGGATTENAPNSARLVAAAPLVAIFFGLGLARVAKLIGGGRWGLAAALVAFGIAWPLAAGLSFYFREYASGSNYDSPAGEATTELGYYLRSLSPTSRVLFVARPRLSCTTHANVRFIADGRTCLDAPEPNSAEVWPALGPDDVVVALPERRAEIERRLAGREIANVREFRTRGRSELLMVAYEPPSVAR